MGWLDPRESKEAREKFVRFITFSQTPFLPEKQPFDFKDIEFEREARELGMEIGQYLKYSPPPKDILFLHRKLGGTFHIIKRMGVQLDIHQYLLNLIEAEL